VLDVVVIDRSAAQTLDDEARRVTLALRNVERLTHNATDDKSRMIYGEIRTALSSARWLTGGLAEALA
jgi:hypothetical protein